MDELDAALRTMLRERAGDITTLPPALRQLPDTAEPPVRAHGRRTRWTVAAAAACVLLVAGVATTVGHQTFVRHEHPPAATTSSPRPTRPAPAAGTLRLPTALPRTAHAARQVSLTSVALRALPGYAVHERSSEPGYRSVAVRARADHGVPVGCNGCESATAFVDVFDAGRFAASRYGVPSWSRTAVRGHAAYLGRMTWLGGSDHRVPTLAWQFAPGRWALVQGVTTYGGTAAALATVAAAIEPDASALVAVPFRLAYVPDLPVTALVDDRSEGYSLTLALGHNDETHYQDPELDLAVSARDPRTVTHTANHRVVVDGVTSWYDRGHGVADIPVPGGTLEIGVRDTGDPTATDRVLLDRVLAGLRIARSGVSYDAEEAVP